ncbi:MAG: hypothetical protein Q8N09_00150 [Thermodesulfovibrionia bacterium]|nr:hypothetical protein [Thermodesulfovibrionia bacterium]
MHRYKILGELITFNNTQGLDLDGILYQNDTNKTTIIHIHGSLGNFYQNQFLRLMAKHYLNVGINLLSFNLGCHDGVGEGYLYENDFKYIGGSITDFSTCIFDIEGAINFTSQFSERIILQGHSLGCDRILHFLISQKKNYDFILLAPCDSYQLQANWIAPETVEAQIERLKAEAKSEDIFDWLPSREYGIRGNGENYVIPITRKALLSIIQGPPYRLIRIGNPSKFSLKQRALIYIGGKDALQTEPSEVMFKYLEERIHDVTRVYVPQGAHSLEGCEYEVIEKIIKWTMI